ncbi:hypothetical protein [Lactobacillus mulieris]|uniref:Uncharacterized protein n=1 Tax=Lactobacillus mulieris TaxID=2508708 RepID=A0AAP3M3F8_9LACO|nr:hypothetical protein [Lactobacillus mulieris]MCW8123407.1 hypothetical protein [Lactobacillus mulieris]MCZ3844117.1 hypothetical protein [Lactobacillus mulieris]MCZ3875777.1 hypothetical protein [Lactobacillus mulieris]MDK7326570.1 hypothetical protein [Lactobacillus mulieris]WEB30187.1 hypothetical protein PUW59_05395 [Lactobacillus mulieris]
MLEKEKSIINYALTILAMNVPNQASNKQKIESLIKLADKDWNREIKDGVVTYSNEKIKIQIAKESENFIRITAGKLNFIVPKNTPELFEKEKTNE